MILGCDEEGVTLPDLIPFNDEKRPKCGSQGSFRNATGEELQELGYSPTIIADWFDRRVIVITM